MGFTSLQVKELASQSLTPPTVASHAVWGEYKAIDLDKHIETIRSFQVLNTEKYANLIIGK